METRGIDISSHQGTEIDFARVKAAGMRFVIVRAGFGNRVSQTFAPQLKGALDAGLETGVYWYSYAGSADEARAEADACLTALEPYRGKLTYPVWFDQEYEPEILALTVEQRTACCAAFLQRVQDAGWYAGLYASLDWLRNKVDMRTLAAYDVWVAQYRDACQYTGAYGIWQYSGSGRVDGVPVPVDLNIAYKDYPAAVKAAGLNGWGKPPTGRTVGWDEAAAILRDAGVTSIRVN